MSEFLIAETDPFPEGGGLFNVRAREQSAPGGQARYVRYPGLSATVAVQSVNPLAIWTVTGYLKVAGTDGDNAITNLRVFCRTQRALRHSDAVGVEIQGETFAAMHLVSFEAIGQIHPSFDGTNWCVYQQVQWVWRQLA